MEKFIGIWIDSRKALIVSLEKGQEQHETVESHATRHVRFPGEPKGMTLSDTTEAKYHEDLRIFFQDVLETIKDAKAIYICGPGLAKENLKKTLLACGELGTRIVKVESADKLTEKQMIAKAKEFFFPKKSAEHGN
ncbi:MAG: hypothetical protein WA705_22270 [Candidatus Ozemobacteraceae bacterium]